VAAIKATRDAQKMIRQQTSVIQRFLIGPLPRSLGKDNSSAYINEKRVKDDDD
jgi:hypothetical protein